MPAIHRRAWRLGAGAVAIVALGAFAGCGDDEEDEGGGDAAAKPATFAVTATSPGPNRRAIEAPASVRAGLVTITLRNSDTVDREAQIVRITGEHSEEEVVKAVTSDGGPIPSWIQDGGGIASVKKGQTGSVMQVLAPGQYVIFDANEGEGENVKSNAEMGATARFEVTGEAGDAELPAVPATITARDYSFSSTGLKSGRNRVRFENTGRELHHAILLPLNPGATVAEAKKFFSEEESSGPPPADFEKIQGTAVIDGGIAQNVELDLEAGNYVAVCFIQDRKGGPPHVAQGMVSAVSVN